MKPYRFHKGDRVGFLTITGERRTVKNASFYETICDCGRVTYIRVSSLLCRTKSCCHVDCPHSLREHHHRTVDYTRSTRTSKKYTKEYQVWRNIKAKCYQPNSKNYSNTGGKGIVVCDEWKHSFNQFNKDMGDAPSPKHTMRRHDSSADFEPDNCYWKAPKGYRIKT